jgi:hypothetical protein
MFKGLPKYVHYPALPPAFLLLVIIGIVMLITTVFVNMSEWFNSKVHQTKSPEVVSTENAAPAAR